MACLALQSAPVLAGGNLGRPGAGTPRLQSNDRDARKTIFGLPAPRCAEQMGLCRGPLLYWFALANELY